MYIFHKNIKSHIFFLFDHSPFVKPLLSHTSFDKQNRNSNKRTAPDSSAFVLQSCFLCKSLEQTDQIASACIIYSTAHTRHLLSCRKDAAVYCIIFSTEWQYCPTGLRHLQAISPDLPLSVLVQIRFPSNTNSSLATGNSQRFGWITYVLKYVSRIMLSGLLIKEVRGESSSEAEELLQSLLVF